MRSFVPIIRDGELDISSHSPEQTERLGIRLGQLLQAGDILCLSGDMGAGKTVFSAGIGQGWGAQSRLTSPTYNLVHEHRHPQDNTLLYHLDCYRLTHESETDGISWDDMLESNGILLIEWAENIESALPPHHLWIDFMVPEPTRRRLAFEAAGKRYEHLITQFRDVIFGQG